MTFASGPALVKWPRHLQQEHGDCQRKFGLISSFPPPPPPPSNLPVSLPISIPLLPQICTSDRFPPLVPSHTSVCRRTRAAHRHGAGLLACAALAVFSASLPVKHLNGEEVTPKMETISHKEFVTVVPDRHDLCSRCIMRKVTECSQRGVDALSPRTSPLCSLCLYRSHSITRRQVVSTNSEQEEELTAHNYTSIQTYVSKSLMPSCVKWVSHR